MFTLRALVSVGLGTAVALASAAAWGQPGKVTASSSYTSINGRTNGFCGMQLIEIDGQPAACFGLLKPEGGKPRYTYLLLFKPALGIEQGLAMEGSGTSEYESNGHVICDLKMKATAGGRTIPVDYKLKTDPKTLAILEETLKVGGKAYGKGEPRVFLVDLADEKATCHPVKIVPTAVPDFTDEDAWGQQILAARKELIEKSPEAKKFFGRTVE